ARAATGRDRILKFEGAFHGNNDYGLMSLSPSGPSRFPRAEPSSSGIPAVLDETVLVAAYNDHEAVERIVAEWSSSLAAIVVEPVQRAIPPAPGFLEELRRLATRHGIVLIFDEVVTGFRLALGGAQEFYGVTPDLAAFGKALAGGFPLAAVVGKSELMAHAARKGAEGAYFSGTLSGNPVSCSAALATIEALSEPGTYARLSQTGERLQRRVEDALVTAGQAACVYGVGAMFQIHFGVGIPSDYRTARACDAAKLEAFAGGMIDRGILYTGQKAYLSLAHTLDEVDRIVEAVADVAAALAHEL
ncbi:MAG: aspartate aminotransferase family protein, partial [Solirubrobacteraceae bacterium]